MKDEIYSLELPAGLDRLIDLAIRVDDHFALRSRHRKGGFPRECVTGAESVTTCDTRSQRLVLPEEEPMQIGGAQLTVWERRFQASSLPPHRPYDCTIDLLPGTSPPKGHLYSLSRPEREAMERYIHDSLVAGIICPSQTIFTKLDLCTAYHLVRIRGGGVNGRPPLTSIPGILNT